MPRLTGGRRLRCLLLVCAVALALAACRPTSEPATTATTPTPRSLSSSNGTDPAATVSATPSPTATATALQTQAPPATPTPYRTETPGPSPTPSRTPTPTVTPSITPTPTVTPTPIPQYSQIIDAVDGAPTPVPVFDVPPRVTNILLLGLDSAEWGNGGFNTDSIIIVSVNRDTGTASMMSLPRDLWVYVPEKGMRRINTVGYGGIYQLRDTILYNFGIPIHYHAQIDFDGFMDIVDAVGGVEIAVSCSLEDWILKERGLDVNDEDNWEWHVVAPGVYTMDGHEALWYARSRKTTSDFDRGRRQQQLMRAILDQSVTSGLVFQVPQLWSIYRERVETDMDIGRMLQLAAVAPDVDKNGVQSIYLAGDNITPIQVEDTDGVVRTAQLPNWDVMQDSFRRLYLPPDLNRATRPAITVEIINASGNPDLAALAAENLLWHGFVPILAEDAPRTVAETSVTYFAPNFKGSFNWLLSWIFDLVPPQPYSSEADYGIDLDAETASAFDYQVVIGRNYDPCRPELNVPRLYISGE